MLRTSDLEIEQYLKDISNKRGVTQKIHFGQKLVSGYWSESESRWHLRTESGREYVAQYIVSGVGALHIPNFPNIPGIDEFAGRQEARRVGKKCVSTFRYRWEL